ncbi:hypothetical protein RB614_23850 [Phytohabitans sp. ZYX-F-186]|uniref:Uncharacterized protein n=1 Tax=Phytohabitans maris TaxID=3071409 RepID=A0ABU0ZKI1_9ACTN|nr:hypothetical protein [Phytohabitans sp. ZYX-F-186]MDQ7907559.1 hypothetical protein [Phytohabitans sp. ZYX-F-186]
MTSAAAVRLEDLTLGMPAATDGFDFPAPRYPAYLCQERPSDIEELMPLARAHVRRRYGRSALGDIKPQDELLIVTYPHQNDMVFEALRRAMLLEGVAKVDRVDVTDLGVEVADYSAAEGWREVTDRVAAMTEQGVIHSVAAARLKDYLDDRPGYTGVHAGESGRRHWKRSAGSRMRNNWTYSTYEDFISRSNSFPDELWRIIDLRVVEAFADAAAVRITSPEGTDLRWDVTAEQAALWVKGAWQSGHILGSTIQGIRFGHSVDTFVREAEILMPTTNGVVAGTSNHTGYFPHAEVHIEGGMISKVVGGGRYGDVFREVIERFKDAQYPGFPYKGWAYFNDASIGTNPKSHRQIETLWKYNDPRTNLPERAQAGVVHFGFGAEHWDQVFLKYARANKLPTMHFPHIHNIFATYEIKQRSTGEWVKLIDKGRLSCLDDPDIVRIANTLGGPELLQYDWIPALPGINYPGDYATDYARDPVSWIRRDQNGEFQVAAAGRS